MKKYIVIRKQRSDQNEVI